MGEGTHTHARVARAQGLCDSTTGVCTCRTEDDDVLFEGLACQRLTCPGAGDCNGRGICLSMAQLAMHAEVNGAETAFSYGLTTPSAATWDAHAVQGCLCDLPRNPRFWYATGYDCSLRGCPKGDDPTTAGVPEIQTVTCTATSGSFRLRFRRARTTAIAYNADAATVKSKLEALPT